MSRSDGYGIRRRRLFLRFDTQALTRSAMTSLLASAIRLALPLLFIQLSKIELASCLPLEGQPPVHGPSTRAQGFHGKLQANSPAERARVYFPPRHAQNQRTRVPRTPATAIGRMASNAAISPQHVQNDTRIGQGQ